MLPRTIVALTGAGVVFALSLATFKWNLPSFVVSAVSGILAGWLT